MALFRKFFPKLIVVLLFSFMGTTSYSAVKFSKYGLVPFSDSIQMSINGHLQHSFDSLLQSNKMLTNKNVINAIIHPKFYNDRTADFYLVLIMIVVLGLIRVSDPKYFQILWQTFKNPSQSSRQLKDKIQSATYSNLFMNLFFTVTLGVYLYFVFKAFNAREINYLNRPISILFLVGGVMVIYIAKYFVIRFSGWAFRVEGITEQYIFNVFLVNKIIAILLLPFIALIAFADSEMAHFAILASFFAFILLFLNRYLRSWQVFGSFFQYSKSHFFIYLCASELLPLAVLMKLLVRGLLINQ